MSIRARPPRLAARLAAACAPLSDRDMLMGDLDERFAQRVRSRGVRGARLWYWGQAVKLAFALVPRRMALASLGIVAPGTARSALRSLARSPRASLAAAATLAAGIAAPSAMFGLLGGMTSSLPGDVEDRVVRVKGFRPVWVGLVLGAVTGVLMVRWLAPGQHHELAYLLPPVLLVATSIFAIWIPTRRAARAAPMEALRDG